MNKIRFDLSIAIVGTECSGKTTLLNLLANSYLSETHKDRNTFFVSHFKETFDQTPNDLQKMRREIRDINETIKKGNNTDKNSLDDSFYDEHSDKIYKIREINGLFSEKIREHFVVHIYDIPGLKSEGTHVSHHIPHIKTWFRKNCHKFDLIIYIDRDQFYSDANLLVENPILVFKEICQEIAKSRSSLDSSNRKKQVILPILNISVVEKPDDNKNTIVEKPDDKPDTEKMFDVFLQSINKIRNSQELQDIKNFIEDPIHMNIMDAYTNNYAMNLSNIKDIDPEVLISIIRRNFGTDIWNEIPDEEKNETYVNEIGPRLKRRNLSKKSNYPEFQNTINRILENNHDILILFAEKENVVDLISLESFDQFISEIKNYLPRALIISDMSKLFENSFNKAIDGCVKKHLESEYNVISGMIHSNLEQIKSKRTMIDCLKKNMNEIQNIFQDKVIKCNEIIEKYKEELNKEGDKLDYQILFNFEFDPENTHTILNVMNLSKNQSDIIIKFIIKRFLKEDNDKITNIFLKNHKYLTDLLDKIETNNISRLAWELLIVKVTLTAKNLNTDNEKLNRYLLVLMAIIEHEKSQLSIEKLFLRARYIFFYNYLLKTQMMIMPDNPFYTVLYPLLLNDYMMLDAYLIDKISKTDEDGMQPQYQLEFEQHQLEFEQHQTEHDNPSYSSQYKSNDVPEEDLEPLQEDALINSNVEDDPQIHDEGSSSNTHVVDPKPQAHQTQEHPVIPEKPERTKKCKKNK